GGDGWRLFPSLRGLGHGVGRLRAELGQGRFQEGNDVGDELRALEPPHRPDGDASGIEIAAAKATADRGEIASRRRAAIFGGENRNSRRRLRGNGYRAYEARANGAQREDDSRSNAPPRHCLPGLAGLPGSPALPGCRRRPRVCSEYSSIWRVRSCGYEIATS